MMRQFSFFFLFFVVVLMMSLDGQTPEPIVVQAANAASPTPVAAVSTQVSESLTSAIKVLQEMKAANEEILKRQKATLEQLDELQKAAEQIKIFANRG